jgi:oxygen-independent coproporphyrinogen-3 oxidase
MSAALKDLAGANLPRYTSYPTAPHFTEAVDGELYRAWLSGLRADDGLSLYLHVPFCQSLCWYCGCNMRVENRYERIGGYLKALEREIALVDAALPPRRLSHLHWGGGTPSYLAAADFARLMSQLRTAFPLQEDAEIAVELDPRRLEPAFVQAMAAAGINRVSLGVQDFTPAVQKAINREQSFACVSGAVERLRAAGIEHINFDLMYGLPHQGLGEAERSARLALQLRPGRIAVFGYAHVPWMKRHQRLIDERALPDETLRMAQAERIKEVLVEAGYTAIGLDHFALPEDSLAVAFRNGRLRRNFQGYTSDQSEVLLGLGPSAIGKLPQGFVQNEPDLKAYCAALLEGRLASLRGCRIDDDDRLRAEVIEGLMCGRRVDLGEAAQRHGFSVDALDEPLERLGDLVALGLVERDGRVLRVPASAMTFSRHVAARFDAYLKRGAARHSRAV